MRLPNHAQVHTNGQGNGSAGGGSQVEQRSKFRQEEVVRIIAQELIALGYSNAARALENESGFPLESQSVASFRNGVLSGDWGVVEQLVSALEIEEEFVPTVLFLIAEQKYLELLERSDIPGALQVLRGELNKYAFEQERLHALSSLMVEEPDVVKSEIGWDGTRGHSRALLLGHLQKYIPPHVMIPERRLETMLEQALTLQRLGCVYHNTEGDEDFETNFDENVLPFPPSIPAPEEQVEDHLGDQLDLQLRRLGGRQTEDEESASDRLLRMRSQIISLAASDAGATTIAGPSTLATRYPGPQPKHPAQSLLSTGNLREQRSSISLYADHVCSRTALFPSVTLCTLEEHRDEVWSVIFSHSGKYLASASKDKTAIVWDVRSLRRLHTLRGHSEPVSYLAFSLDDKYLLTCGNDNKIQMWDVAEGTCKLTIQEHSEPVTSCAWLPDHSFVSGSHDMNMFLWSKTGEMLYKWQGVRIRDMDISSDGKTLITACPENRIRIYNMAEKRPIGQIQEKDTITSLCISKNARYALVNLSSQAVHLWDLHKAKLVRKYIGHRQGRFVIRSCLGGVRETFVVSGSEDSYVYVWHRGQAQLIEVLGGHTQTVNSVAWNPRDPYMFASASDDRTVRIWTTAERAAAHAKHLSS